MSAARQQGLAWWAWVAFVVYGSLLPFDFHPLPWAEALTAFGNTPFLQLGIESRADWVANGVLYLPVGLLGVLALGPGAGRRGWPAALSVPLVLAVGSALAVAVEFTQLFFPPRTVSQNDILAECIGTALGAVVAPLLAPWVDRLGAALRTHATALGPRLLELYGGAYLLLSLFPFDLLLSGDEWAAKLASDQCGWWLAEASRQRGWLVPVLLGAEAMLAMPFGVLLALRRRAPGSAVGAALTVGVLLGLAIECAQLAVASGISQGLSVPTRALGMALGAAAWQAWRARAVLTWRHTLRPWLLPAGLVHLLLLLAASGLLGRPLKDGPTLQAAWAELRWMPFYYHYYTTEAEAVFSLGSVALLYLPLAVLGWLRPWPRGAVLVLVALLAAGVEGAKLLLAGLHPDPSNVLIAVCACALARPLLGWLEQPAASPLPTADPSTRPAAPMAPAPLAAPLTTTASAPGAAQPPPPGGATAGVWSLPTPGRGLLAVLCVALALATVARLPVAAPVLAVALGLAFAVLLWRPAWGLALLPAAWYSLDATPWTGRLYWGEVDALALLVLAAAWWRTPPASQPVPARWSLLWLLLAAALGLAALRTLAPWAWPDENTWVGLYGPMNGLRVARGLWWAGLLLALARRWQAPPAAAWPLLAAGLALGTVAAVAVVLWERWAFVGVLDVTSDYRVTGPFSAMHTGGAYIEAQLTLGAAVLCWWVWQARRPWVRLLAAVSLLGTTYAVMVTYSRNGFAALAVVALVMALAIWRQRAAALAGGRWLAPLLVLAMAALAWPIVQGGFASQRLAASRADLAVRQAHWADALALRADGPLNLVLGEGLGRFPAAHYWRSAETPHASAFGLVPGAPGQALRLTPGAPVYIEQLVPVRAGQPLQLTLQLRSLGAARLGVALCEKWLLTSAACASAELPLAGATPGWQNLTVPLAGAAWRAEATSAWRPVKLALFHAGGPGTLDLTRLHLRTSEAGPDLLHNGDFAQGLDRWFFSTDIDPPWHVHNTAVQVLLEQGLLGSLALGLAVVVALWRAGRRAWAGDAVAACLLAALAGLGVCGLLNTLTDDPRLLGVLLLLLGLALAPAPTGAGAGLARSRRPGPSATLAAPP